MRFHPDHVPLLIGCLILAVLAAATIHRWAVPKCADNEIRATINGVNECVVIDWPRGPRR